MRIIFTLIISILVLQSATAQNYWQPATPETLPAGFHRDIIPQVSISYKLDLSGFKNLFTQAPLEFTQEARNQPLLVELPNPDGSFSQFAIVESPIMEAGLALQFPNIKTYSGQGITDRTATLKIDFTDWGFHAQVLSVAGAWYIDPYSKANTSDYIVYFKKDYFNFEKSQFKELPPIAEDGYSIPKSIQSGTCIGDQLRTYRLAVACTGEYAQAATGLGTPSVSQTLSCITTTVNRVDGIYESEIAVRMVLIATESSIVYTNPATDPFTGNNNAGTLITQSQTTINSVIGSANYDMGHTFSTGGGGLSNLGCVCKSSSKAKSITGSSTPVGDAYDVDYVAHEMGHALGGDHTFGSGQGSCSGNGNGPTAYEPGSGTTIMAYAGICGNDDIQTHSDPFFHTASFDQIVAYTHGTSGNTCAVKTNTGNNPPTVTMPTSGKTIPKGTPFYLTGSATDPDNDAITYCWEEMDQTSASTTWNGGASSTTAPLFKSRIPTTSPTRYFPSLAVIKAGYPAGPSATMGGLKGETLPLVSRTMDFRLTVRDNKNGGGGVATGGNGCSSTAPFTLNVDGNSGPFKELVPNGGESYPGGTWQNVTWDVAGTNAAPVSCAMVDVVLSTDGGNTFPTVLIANIPNNGSAFIPMPNPASTTTNNRLMIRCSDNYFFDIGDGNFTLTHNSSPDGIANVLAGNLKIQLAPNPASTEILLSVTNTNSGEPVSYEILNALGQICASGTFYSDNQSGNRIAVNQLAKGLYLVNVRSGEKRGVARFVKE